MTKLKDTADLIVGIIGVIIALAFIAIISYAVLSQPPESERPCEYFKDYRAQSVPARCIDYFNKQKQ